MAWQKDPRIKTLLVDYWPIIMLFLVLIIYFCITPKKDFIDNNPQGSWNNIDVIWPLNESWFVEKWWELYTGLTAEEIWKDIIPNPQTDESLYSKYVQNWNSASFVPSSQNKMSWWYATKTQLMDDYLANNTFKFNVPNNIKKWYLYIKLHSPSTDWIFLFWYGSDNHWYKVSWDLKLEKNLLNSTEEYLFTLSDIPYTRFYDKKDDSYNWLSELQNWKSRFIAWFLRVYDWTNKIDQISIAWE